MDNDQKWLEAAAAIEQDIIYLKAAMADGKKNGILLELEQDVFHLNAVLGIYRTNAATGIVFPNPAGAASSVRGCCIPICNCSNSRGRATRPAWICGIASFVVRRN